MSRERQTASETIAQKADAYGIPGVLVDGNDVLAVFVVTRDAVGRARRGEGATLIEAQTQRMGAHTTADDAGRYRDEAILAAWKLRDPIDRVRKYLQVNGAWSEAWEQELIASASVEIETAANRAEGLAPFDQVPPSTGSSLGPVPTSSCSALDCSGIWGRSMTVMNMANALNDALALPLPTTKGSCSSARTSDALVAYSG